MVIRLSFQEPSRLVRVFLGRDTLNNAFLRDYYFRLEVL